MRDSCHMRKKRESGIGIDCHGVRRGVDFIAGGKLYIGLSGTVFRIGDYAELGKITIKIVIKIIGISYLIEFSSGLIEDFGLKSLSDKIVFVGKIAILTTAYPIIEKLIKTVTELI